MDIIIISPAPFDYPIWTNRQHIAAQFSKNNRVLYVFLPNLLRSSLKRCLPGYLSKRQADLNANIHIYTPIILPFSSQSLLIHKMNIKISCFFIKQIIKKLQFKDYLLWFYHPEGVFYLNYLEPKIACYDCVDEYSTMPDYKAEKKKSRLKYLEKKLIEKCDIVFTTSSNLYESKKSSAQNIFLVENVGDYGHFKMAQKKTECIPRDFPPVNAPVIGFVGALDPYKVDYQLIEHIAFKKHNWIFVMIGAKQASEDQSRKLPEYSNIFYLGRKIYKDLPKYISLFDICIIPYKINDYTRHVFPIKLFEYLSAGKPVVATALPSIRKYDGVIKIAETNEDFLLAMDNALKDNAENKINDRIHLAKANTWESRANKLLSHVRNILNPEDK